MNTKYSFPLILLLTILCGCSSSDDETLVNNGGRKLRQLTITQVEDSDVTRSLSDLTRASITENVAEKTLSAILLIMRSDFFEFVRNHGIQYVRNIGILRGVKQ